MDCQTCGGVGVLLEWDGERYREVDCEDCRGTGQVQGS
jgi:DnaJ-class molecular chaperone